VRLVYQVLLETRVLRDSLVSLAKLELLVPLETWDHQAVQDQMVQQVKRDQMDPWAAVVQLDQTVNLVPREQVEHQDLPECLARRVNQDLVV